MGANNGKRPESSQANSKTRSRELMSQTGDKFNDLYNLAKRMQGKPKTDKTSEEIEFEKFKEECTFAPNSQRVKISSQVMRNQEPETPITEDKFVQKEIERMKKAREERERVKKYTERGIILNENHSAQKNFSLKRPSTVTNAASSHIKPANGFAS